jgi:benzodiazapine receptor
MKINFPKLITALLIPQVAGILGAVFTTSSISMWYATLERPSFSPPNWIFGPVWTTLYALMGIAAYLVWTNMRAMDREKKKALKLFAIQLVLNTLWSIIFFGQHNIGGALIEIVVLWCAIMSTIMAFAKVSRPAAWLLVPYILWVSFAAYLNYSFWIIN